MARKITGAAFLSLDGVMQAPGGPTEDPTGGFDQGGWVFKLWDEGIDETLARCSPRPTTCCWDGVPTISSPPTGLMPMARTSRWAKPSTLRTSMS